MLLSGAPCSAVLPPARRPATRPSEPHAGACKAGLLWTPEIGGVTNLWIADVKAVREQHDGELRGVPTGEAWNRRATL